jgi:hypothetical protein
MFKYPLGTQVEIPVSLKKDKLDRATSTYEAVLAGTDGNNVVLTVRVPVSRGDWDAAATYSAGDEVVVGTTTYALAKGTAVVSDVAPGLSRNWTPVNPDLVYIQIPHTLVAGGILELSVTETGVAFPRILKVFNDTIEFTTSPTELV